MGPGGLREAKGSRSETAAPTCPATWRAGNNSSVASLLVVLPRPSSLSTSRQCFQRLSFEVFVLPFSLTLHLFLRFAPCLRRRIILDVSEEGNFRVRENPEQEIASPCTVCL